MRQILLLFALLLTCSLTAQEVIITGLIDGTQSGSPRAIELYVSGTVNLSSYTIDRYTNGAGSITDMTSLSGTYTDEFVYVINNQHDAAFTSAFGNSGDFANRIFGNNILGTGDDAFALAQSGTIIDVVGGTIGTGFNNYQDSWLYRNDNTGPDGAWVAANWMNVGNTDALEGLSLAQMGAAVPFGTYQTTPPGPSVSITATTDMDEDGTNGAFTLTLSEAAAGSVTITYALTGTAQEGTDYSDPSSGSVTIPNGQFDAVVTLSVIDDATSEPTETVTLSISSISDATFSAGAPATLSVFDNEPVSAINISSVQGSGSTSPLLGQTVTVEGIVVGDFQGASGTGLGGFFLQEEDADSDLDPATSDGIWIFDGGTGMDVAPGDLVSVTGVVEESNDLTQINVTGNMATVAITSTGNALPTPAQLDLPVSAESDYEPLEGMLTTVIDDVEVTSNFGIARFGEFEVSEGGRLVQFTECNESDASALAAYNDALELRTLIVDDGRSGDNNYPIVLADGMEVSATNTLRAGTIITGLTGVVDERFTGYRFQATGFGRTASNPRPASAPAVGGNLTVVGMNVLNYFTTLGSRGADDADEFNRQEAKIVNAIIELDADVIGLAEIENNGFGSGSAVQTLIDAVTAKGGPAYTAVINPNSGSDQIQVALVYKADVVEESGTAANLTTGANFSSNRIPLAQTFRVIEPGNPNFGQQVTVCINHWKSKSGSCGSGDDDNGGAGSCNGTRTAAAQAIADWLNNDDPTGTGETDQLIIGDLNAYSQEDPLLTLENEGFVNLVRALAGPGSFPCGSIPSYVFAGQWGSLDHAFASASLSSLVTGATPWNVNADEPTALDYDTRYNDPALYADDFYRFSDHDPIVIGLDLGASLPVELTDFSGQENNGDVDLVWTTQLEINTDRFEVQRSLGNGNFSNIGSLAAAGNSDSPRTYAFTDTDPAQGDNDYRLRIIDLDGSESFSNVITVNVEATNSLSVVRSGERSYRLSGARPGTEFLLTNAGGAIIRRDIVTTATQDIDGANLPAGIYFLVVGGQRTETFKLVLR